MVYWIHGLAKKSMSELMQILLKNSEFEVCRATSDRGSFTLWVLFLDFELCEEAGHFREIKKYATTIYNATGIPWVRFMSETPGLHWNVLIEEENGVINVQLEDSFLHHAN